MMRIQTGRRLHFGLFAPVASPEENILHGGLGIMVDVPGVIMEAQSSTSWTVTGQQNEQVERVISTLRESVNGLIPLHIHVNTLAPAHQGWGTGTQLALAVAHLVCAASNRPWSVQEAAHWMGRGNRSSIGIAGFEQGGLLLDEGKPARPGAAAGLSSVTRHVFPAEWTFVLVEPGTEAGLYSEAEKQAFRSLQSIDHRVVRQLRELAVNYLIPAARARDFTAFASNLTKYNRLAGSFYRDIQKGDYSSPLCEQRLAIIQEHGAIGRGQSSWGPGLYAVFASRQEAEEFSQRCVLAGCRMYLANVMKTGCSLSR